MKDFNIIFSLVLLLVFQDDRCDGWKWVCDSNQSLCTRLGRPERQNDEIYPTIETCRLLCSPYGGLWPLPTNYTKLSKKIGTFDPSGITFTISAEGNALNLLNKNKDCFYDVFSKKRVSCSSRTKFNIALNVAEEHTVLDWNVDESYKLEIKSENDNIWVDITAITAFGARHGLETLLQLIEDYPSDNSVCLIVPAEVKILDKPKFTHRGLLIDSARNFVSIPTIKKHLDGMAMSKMNVMHWHITDTQSFPLYLPSLPNMTNYGAYSAKHIYHPDEIQDLKDYALTRGIRIIIEIDAPAHAGNGWQWGPETGLGDLAVCINQDPYRSYCIEPPCGQLNPINDNLYPILEKLYKDIYEMFPEMKVFHMGGDEVFVGCWNTTKEIIDYLNGNTSFESFMNLWNMFQNKALDAFDRASNSKLPIILWTSDLTDPLTIQKYLSKDRYVIQTWVPADSPIPDQLLDLGYRIIVSTKDKWYLDHGFWGSTKYHDWRAVYANTIPNQSLGGEVCMWGEYVGDTGVLTRVWPRAAAAAERLWSNPRRSYQMEQRFYRHRERLAQRGIDSDMVAPRWCFQNEGRCQ